MGVEQKTSPCAIWKLGHVDDFNWFECPYQETSLGHGFRHNIGPTIKLVYMTALVQRNPSLNPSLRLLLVFDNHFGLSQFDGCVPQAQNS